MCAYTEILQDEVLDKAIQKAEADIEKAKKDADDKKWRIVADYMKTMKACKFVLQMCLRSLTDSSPYSLLLISLRKHVKTDSMPARLEQRSQRQNQFRTRTSLSLPELDHELRKSRGSGMMQHS